MNIVNSTAGKRVWEKVAAMRGFGREREEKVGRWERLPTRLVDLALTLDKQCPKSSPSLFVSMSNPSGDFASTDLSE